MSTAAAGGLRPGRPDQHYEPPAGGQAIPGQRGVVRARQVIVFGTGPNSGIFVYSPTPGAGNLIASITADGTTADPYGNTVLSGITEYHKVTSSFFTAVQLDRGEIVFYDSSAQPGPWTALYTMNAAPAFGIQDNSSSNTIGMSSAGSGGPALTVNGESRLSGSATITGDALATALEISAGALQNGLDINGAFTVDGFGDLTFKGLLQALESAVANLIFASQVTGDTNNRLTIGADGTMNWGPGNAATDTTLARVGNPGLDLNISHNNVNALAVTNGLGNGGFPLVQLTTSAGTDRALGVEAAGDTAQRLRLDALPQIAMGPGNASTDCAIARAGPSQFYSDGISAKVSGAAETWHLVGGTGNAAFANGWTNAPTGPNLQYRAVAAPYNCIQWVGRLIAPAGVVVAQAITTAPVAAYHPADIGDIIAWDATQNAIVALRIGTAGVLTYQGGALPANGDVITIPAGNGIVSLDA